MIELPWIEIARSYIGVKEVKGLKHESLILRMWKAIKRGGIKDDETPWCSAFVGACLEEAGIVSSRYESAKSYLAWGIPCNLIYGCVLVLTRSGGSGYHVGYAVGIDADGNVQVLSGNQSDSVSIASFNPNRIVARRWPKAAEVVKQSLPLLKKVSASTKES
jgi:uncharacterized protein (TIGR02594 family)